LSVGTLALLDKSVRTPTYAREALRRSIVHIGVGGFHRAHLATYIDELCADGNTDWAIVGAGVLAGDATMAETLGSQDGLYCLITRGSSETTTQVIGSIVDFIHAHPDPEPLIAAIGAADTQVVSLTITEGGYPIDDRTGLYLADHPMAGPTSAVGLIAAGLQRRQHNGGVALTIMSCDNIMSNGTVTRTAVLGEAERLDADLVRWIEQEVSFPNSMVDRITPATADRDRAWLADNAGINDAWPVVTEPFRQWVIEDRFAGDRIPLESLDVIVTDDVEPYEHMKLRLLNAGHSCLAYLSALLGHEHVHTAMADPAISSYVRGFLDLEAHPALPPVAGIDLEEYKDSLIERFSNPEIADQISRLCLDGSAKFPKFLLPTVRDNLQAGGGVALAALGLAGWCQYLTGMAEDGSTIDVAADPDLESAVSFATAALDDPASFLGFSTVFDSELASSAPFATAFADAVQALRTKGVRSSIESVLEEAEHAGVGHRN
jgi:mannitol 2-dehydrogenase